MKLKRIVAAVGAFPQDEAVLARALEFKASHGGELIIIHVVDLPDCDDDLDRVDTLCGQAALAAKDRIEAALTGLGADPGAHEIRIESGSPGLRLIDICGELDPGLVVMRAHQRSGITERILGSTTDRVIAAGNQPVLVVKRPVERAYGMVLVATDGTDDAVGALGFAQGLLPEAELHLVQVVQIAPQLKEVMLRSGTDQVGISAHHDALTRIARNRLAEVAHEVAPEVKTHVLRGDPATALSRASRVDKVDLITAGPGRSSLIRRAFLGSVTRRLLRDAACDVLIFHAGEDRA